MIPAADARLPARGTIGGRDQAIKTALAAGIACVGARSRLQLSL